MMRILTFVIVLIMVAGSVQSEIITQEEFLNQFSNACRPHAKSFAVNTSIATNLLNEHRYEDADAFFNRRVNGSILNLMNSNDCNSDDRALMMQLSASVRPLEDNIICLLRVHDSQNYFSEAKEYAESHNFNDAHTLMGQATYAIKEIIDSGRCRHLPQNEQNAINELRDMLVNVETEIGEVLEEFDE